MFYIYICIYLLIYYGFQKEMTIKIYILDKMSVLHFFSNLQPLNKTLLYREYICRCIYIYICIYIYMYLCIFMYIIYIYICVCVCVCVCVFLCACVYKIFSSEGFLEVAIESWSELI